MSAQYVAALVPQINGILSSADLSTISAKGIRKQLIASGHEESVIKENRGAIDEKIAEIYEKLTSNRDLGTPPSSAGPSTSANPPSSLPEPLRKPKIKTEVKDEIKTKSRAPAPAPSSARRIDETDEEMAARLQREFDAEGSTGRASRSAGAPKKKAKRVKKRKADDDEDGTPKKRRGGGGGAFNKELLLSDALAAFVGEPRLSRPQVVKRIWEYVKERGLQDPADKRYILCDDALRSIFGTDKVHMFTMNKILAAHVRNDDEIAYKAEPSNGVKHEYKPITSSPARPNVHSSAVKSDLYTLSQATIEDSDSELEVESEDEDY